MKCYLDAQVYLGNKTERPIRIGKNLRIKRIDDDCIAIKHYDTYIVKYYPNFFTVNTEGHHSYYTKRYINMFTKLDIYQKHNIWYLGLYMFYEFDYNKVWFWY